MIAFPALAGREPKALGDALSIALRPFPQRIEVPGSGGKPLIQACNIADDIIFYVMRVVLDTNVIVAAMRSPLGASAGLLRAIAGGHATLVLSAAMALEYEAVCTMPEHRDAAGLTAAEVLAFVDGTVALAEPVIMRFSWRPQLRDPNDEMVLETAVNGRADAIVTFNGRDFVRAPAGFGIEVLKPVEVLRRLSQ